jgi:hypothetical protein
MSSRRGASLNKGYIFMAWRLVKHGDFTFTLFQADSTYLEY